MLTYELIAMFGRVLLAVTLAVAGLGKLRSRAAFDAFAETFGDLGWRSGPGRRAAAAALPGAELGSAVLLAVPPTLIWGYAAALTLLAAMTATAAMAVKRGRRVRCRCFGLAEESIGASTLTRNTVLVAAGLAGLAGALASAGRAGSPAAQVLGAGLGLIGAAVIVYWAELGYLLRGRPTAPGQG
ncbi:MAG TPA: MauE/DoxX family redox-associated membrane protein [Streptosporangiaceae bacterium]|nr:MauE/DoxX family redox-associated membrane protein [Streptosporangiaceae bacterium]